MESGKIEQLAQGREIQSITIGTSTIEIVINDSIAILIKGTYTKELIVEAKRRQVSVYYEDL